ncbi:SEC14-like protein 2 [Orchesella cincta]|uniref:SEC14-like protein 2 n=1 Tax=Orchesella cincta TaxID=48709 RepID=A0A1D2NKC2_ORCCI|nr:SEC14-like protein 2 [Orchesella cincta]
MIKFLILFVSISVIYLISVDGANSDFTELNKLTPSHRASLEKFKQAVSPILPYDYMKEDIYLVKWMQAQGFSARKAEQMIREALKWRSENKIDTWEDSKVFSEFEKDYPIFIDGSSKEGFPIVESYFGDWNVRSIALQGKMKQLILYSLRGIERATTKLRERQAQGKNVTQWILLLKHGRVQHYQSSLSSLPTFVFGISPDSFEIVLNLIRPIMSPPTRASLKVFSSNKAEWKPYLDNLIDPAEISDWFDGKKERKPAS